MWKPHLQVNNPLTSLWKINCLINIEIHQLQPPAMAVKEELQLLSLWCVTTPSPTPLLSVSSCFDLQSSLFFSLRLNKLETKHKHFPIMIHGDSQWQDDCGCITQTQWNFIRREKTRYQQEEMQSTQTTPPHLLEHTHLQYTFLSLILYNTHYISQTTCDCEIDFGGALPHKHPLSSLKAEAWAGRSTHF